MLSRSGIVFLVKNESAEKAAEFSGRFAGRFAGRVLRHKYRAIVLLLIMGITTLVLKLPHTPAETQVDTSAPLPSEVTVDCQSLLAEPGQVIEAWLGGTTDSRIAITELSLHQIGGLRSRVIEVDCGSHSTVLRVTLVLREKDWRLKKFARLEN